MLDGTEFGRLFERFHRTAFRLETLDLYDVEEEQEEFAAFLAGEVMPPERHDNPWVRSMTDRDGSPASRYRPGVIELPSRLAALVVRTDFSGSAPWGRLREALATPNEDGFLAHVHLVDNPRFADVTCDEAVSLLPSGYRHPLLVLADRATLISSELPLLALDLRGGPGRSVRVVAAELWCIENNLSIVNMDFDEFADGVDEDGVFRGF
ncbi:DUF6879 family protein [Kitasatospora sp. NPDC094019]|uniref:DUF6879 family protein n=1 Tax=Kitasatospora sp. NPDC094019 TaxID=3364091 RepID=UPI0037FBC924